MKQLAFSTDSHPNKYTRQRVWTSRNWFYSWVFSCLVTYLLVFRGVDEIGCHHFRKKRTTLDCLTIKLRNKENVRKIESTWGHDNKKLTGKRPLCCIFFGQIVHEDKLTGKKPNLVYLVSFEVYIVIGFTRGIAE